MPIEQYDFSKLQIRDLYGTLLNACEKMNYYLDIMATHNMTSGTYIDAMVSEKEWTEVYNKAFSAMVQKYGETFAMRVKNTINKQLEVDAEKKEIFLIG